MSKPSSSVYRRYNQSPKGQARYARYARSEKRRASYRKYQATEKGIATALRYRSTAACKIVEHLRNTSAPVRLAKRLWAQAHRG